METTKEELQKQLNAIQKELDNFKEEPELEVGKWYKLPTETNFIICITDLLKGEAYGFDINGKWYENTDFGFSNIVPATDKEVEEALIKEAKKRGFKEGVKVKTGKGYVGLIKGNYNHEFRSFSNRFYFNNILVLRDGKWAEIIEDSKPKINGYEMEFEGDFVKFGCAKFNQQFFYDLLGDLEYSNDIEKNYKDQNRKIKSITLDSDVEITVKQLKEVVDYLNK